MQNAAAIRTVSWISLSVAPCCRARRMSSLVTCLPPICTFPAIANSVFSLPDIEVQLHIVHELFISTQTVSSHGSVSVLTEVAIVLRRDIVCNHLAISRG